MDCLGGGRFESDPRALIHRYLPPPGDDGYGYWRGLADIWDADDAIVNVEWDMEYSPAMAAQLLRCPYPLCTHAYQMHIPRTYYAHSTHPDGMGGFWVGRARRLRSGRASVFASSRRSLGWGLSSGIVGAGLSQA